MNEICGYVRNLVQKYNHKKYWKYRERVVEKIINIPCVIVEDVPDNCTVVMNKPRILRRTLQHAEKNINYNGNI